MLYSLLGVETLDEASNFDGDFPTSFKLDALAGLKYIYAEPLLDEINEKEILDELAKATNKLTNAEKNRNTLNEEKEFDFK